MSTQAATTSRKRAPYAVDQTIAMIRAYARFRDWSKTELAKRAGLHDTTLRNFWRPTWNPHADILRLLHQLIPHDFDPRTAPKVGKYEEVETDGTRTQENGG